MNQNRLQRLLTIVDQALVLEGEERMSYLNDVCGEDTALREEAEDLLGSVGKSESFWEGWKEWNEQQVASLLSKGDGAEKERLRKQFSHYLLSERLGAGGMGVVYRARDTRLERDVAVKFLPPVWSVNKRAKERFLHEARTAASLDHPNICTIHEVNETGGGTLYIVMAFYEGETLRTRLEKGPLEMDETLDLAAQTARGLAAAHTKGLVHRDIKPANLMITDGSRVKILDFGIAKAADVTLTLPGQPMGTAAYMAPEQAEGKDVDGRADLWSLGVVLYEMLTGIRPADANQGDKGVPPPSDLREDIPAFVDDLIFQMLEKRPEKRPGHAEDIVNLLEHYTSPSAAGRSVSSRRGAHGLRRALKWGVVILVLVALAGFGSYALFNNTIPPFTSPAEAVAASPSFLAVLPFDNQGPDLENDYFADGITDDILTQLAQVPDFSVISRTTTMNYKEGNQSIPEIAEELGVGYVLEGSVRRMGDQIRIISRLVDGRTDQHLWSETYDRALEDIFAVQTEIAQSIAGALEVELSGDVASRMERSPTEDLEAYDLFLVGRENFYRYDAEGNQRAIELFKQALERDRDFTQARSWLSLTYAHHDLIFGMGRAWADSALTEARHAIAAQPDLPDAYGALGDAYLAIGQYTDAVAAYEQALQLNPSDWHAAVSLGAAHEGQNRWDEAIRLSRRSLELNPVRSHIAYANLTMYYANLGLYRRAEAALRRALAVDPDIPDVIFSGGYLHLLNHRHEAALEAAERLAEIGAANSIAALYASQLFTWTGEIERARVVAEAAYERSPTASRAYIVGVLYGYTLDRTGESENSGNVFDEMERYIHEQIERGGAGIRTFRHSLFPHSLAVIHALRGEHDEAFLWLDEAIRSGWNHAALLPDSDPLLENIHDDPRFQTAMDHMERDLTAMRERVERKGW